MLSNFALICTILRKLYIKNNFKLLRNDFYAIDINYGIVSNWILKQFAKFKNFVYSREFVIFFTIDSCVIDF